MVLALVAAACSSSDKKTAATTTAKTASTATTASPGKDSAKSGAPLARYADYRSKEYRDPSHWVCRPEARDICDDNLDATEVAANGTLTVHRFKRATDAPIDCFYVYPTISRDQSVNSDWNASPDEEGFVTLNQAARLQSQCRLFAPVYRQTTLAGLASRLTDKSTTTGPTIDPYADVLDAFRTYMADDNNGRGFVLIGHSQGASILKRLIADEIDPNGDVRSHLVAAYLAGAAVGVPTGRDVGGDFKHVPVCHKSNQTGCVIAWASFRSTAPPTAGSYFGKAGTRPGDPAGAGIEAVCANPADLGNDEDTPLDSYFPANRTASILSDLKTSITAPADGGWVAASAGTITTPYVSVRGLASGHCIDADGYHVLSITVHGDPADPRADDIPGDLTPQWGLHLVDVNLVMGNIVDLVASQAKAYAG